jgi:hypothetical protein
MGIVVDRTAITRPTSGLIHSKTCSEIDDKRSEPTIATEKGF